MMPFPIPEITPPVTRMYFIVAFTDCETKENKKIGQRVKRHFGRSGLDPYLGPPLFDYRLIPLQQREVTRAQFARDQHRSEISTQTHYSAGGRAEQWNWHVFLWAPLTQVISGAAFYCPSWVQKPFTHNNIHPPAFSSSHFTIWWQQFFMLWFCLSY